jgi:hypothetical protein
MHHYFMHIQERKDSIKLWHVTLPSLTIFYFSNHIAPFWKGKHKQSKSVKAFLQHFHIQNQTLKSNFAAPKCQNPYFSIQHCPQWQQEFATIVFEIFFEVISFDAGNLLTQKGAKGRLLDNVWDIYIYIYIFLKICLTKMSRNCYFPATSTGIIMIVTYVLTRNLL